MVPSPLVDGCEPRVRARLLHVAQLAGLDDQLRPDAGVDRRAPRIAVAGERNDLVLDEGGPDILAGEFRPRRQALDTLTDVQAPERVEDPLHPLVAFVLAGVSSIVEGHAHLHEKERGVTPLPLRIRS